MDVAVTPPLGPSELRALLAALEQAAVREPVEPRGRAWWRAGLREAVGHDDADAGYALSPRNTRGATRA